MLTVSPQALLSVGDIILEVNGVNVDTPEALVAEISRAKDNVTLKIAPSFEDTTPITGGLHNGHAVNGAAPCSLTTMVCLYTYLLKNKYL